MAKAAGIPSVMDMILHIFSNASMLLVLQDKFRKLSTVYFLMSFPY